MFTRKSMLVAALLCACALQGAVRAMEQDVGGEALAQSYDREAAGKLKEALVSLDQLPQQRKESYLGWARRGWLLYRLGQYAESVDAYRKAIAAAPKSIEPRLGILLPELALRRWTDAEQMAKEILQSDPGSYLATLRLAFVYYNQHRFAESAALYGRLRELYPSDTDVRAGLGWALLKAGRPQEAAHEFQELLAINPRLATAREGLQLANTAH